jgi:hypothetical protein
LVAGEDQGEGHRVLSDRLLKRQSAAGQLRPEGFSETKDLQTEVRCQFEPHVLIEKKKDGHSSIETSSEESHEGEPGYIGFGR